jgi:hypothetical protein
MTDLLLTSSSEEGRILPFLFLHLLLKGNNSEEYNGEVLTFSRWIFYSAVNSVTPLIVLNLGFESSSWRISIRQLAYTLPTLFTSIPITYVDNDSFAISILTRL